MGTRNRASHGIEGPGSAPGKGAVRAPWGPVRRFALALPSAFLALALALVMACTGPARVSNEPEVSAIPPPVLTPPPIAKPGPGEPVETWSTSVEDVAARELLFALARDAGIDMDIDPGIEATVTMNAVDVPLPRLLERISRNAGLRVEVEDGTLVARPDEPVLRTYPIDYVPLERETQTVNEVGTGLGSGMEASAGDDNGSLANVTARSEHRFWEALIESVRGVLGDDPDTRANVFAHRETSLVAVRARAAGHREVALLLDRILASARRQVLIEATIVEVSLDDRFRGGVDVSRAFGAIEVETGLLGGNLGSPPFARLSIPDLSLTVRLLSEFGDVRVLSTPLVMALNNQTAIVKIAENRAFFTSEVRTETNETSTERNVQTNLHTVPVGLILLVTPAVAADDEIILKIRPTVTREIGFVVDPNPELAAAGVVSRIPEIAIREIESVLRLRSGEVAVLGGLMREETRETTTGVPFLSRLPGIGSALRYRDRDRDKTELFVFLRPTVVREPSLDGALREYRRWWPASRKRASGHGVGAAGQPSGAKRRDSAPDRFAPARIRIDRSWMNPPADGVLERAWGAFRRGDHRAARAGYLEALDTHPADAMAGLGATALRERRAGEAKAWYERLAALDPEHETARTMALVLDRNADPAARERELTDRIGRSPDSDWLQVALGNAHGERGDWEAAAGAYRAAHRLAPSNPDPAYNLAVTAERLARPRLALLRYRDALELTALSPPAFDLRTARERAAELERRLEARP